MFLDSDSRQIWVCQRGNTIKKHYDLMLVDIRSLRPHHHGVSMGQIHDVTLASFGSSWENNMDVSGSCHHRLGLKF